MRADKANVSSVSLVLCRAQHVSGLEVVRDVCAGKLAGAHVGSCSVTFHPGLIQSGTFLTDTKTAGSVA